MKKVLLISLVGPILVIVWRVIDVIKKVNILGVGTNYSCNISTDAKCSLPFYIFKSDDAVLSYIAMILSFILLCILTSYIFFLIGLYKNDNHKLFWILIGLTIAVVIACPFIIDYIQLIS